MAKGERGAADAVASAQVIVRSQSGTQVRGDVPITTENLAQYQPSADDAAAAQAAFGAAGFEVGPMVGISFSITAPLSRFEQVFGVPLRVDEGGAVAAAAKAAPAGGMELPLHRLPGALAERVAAVAFTPPADLHGEGGMLMI